MKYPHLAKVVKAALVVPHGNADVEMGFSVNNIVVASERSKLNEELRNETRKDTSQL